VAAPSHARRAPLKGTSCHPDQGATPRPVPSPRHRSTAARRGSTSRGRSRGPVFAARSSFSTSGPTGASTACTCCPISVCSKRDSGTSWSSSACTRRSSPTNDIPTTCAASSCATRLSTPSCRTPSCASGVRTVRDPVDPAGQLRRGWHLLAGPLSQTAGPRARSLVVVRSRHREPPGPRRRPRGGRRRDRRRQRTRSPAGWRGRRCRVRSAIRPRARRRHALRGRRGVQHRSLGCAAACQRGHHACRRRPATGRGFSIRWE
jgi:hypothetical protein